MAESPDEVEAVVERAGQEDGVSLRPVFMRDRYMIEPSSPIPGLASPSAKAYAASDRQTPDSNIFALICTPGLPLRENTMAHLKGGLSGILIPLIDWDPVDWPLLGRKCLALILERPLGGRFCEGIASPEAHFSEHDMTSRFLEPMSRALRQLDTRDLPHRAIRLNNMFFMDADLQDLVLGDCFTAPPGYDQPLVFETIERGMASPAGRGEGSISEDIYALGVCLVMALLGRNPVGALNDDKLIAAKVEIGSYATLCGKERIPINFIEPLRGMLSDDPGERWGLDELELWISGSRLTPIQKKSAPRADTGFLFGNAEHVTARTLAHALSRDIAEAAKAIRGGEVELWTRRGLGNSSCADAIATAVSMAQAHTSDHMGSSEYLVTKVCILLDPQGPIRYKDMSFMPEGFGAALAVDFLLHDDPQASAEVIAREILDIWFQAQEVFLPANAELEKNFGEIRSYVLNNNLGHGIERCLYELNPSLPCQGKTVVEDYVADIDDLLPALNEASRRVDTNSSPVDRHIAAFIAARFNHDIRPHLKAMADSDPERSTIGLLSLLALLQWRLDEEVLYGLSSWVGGLLGPAISSYHSRTTRSEMEHRIPRLVRQGSLPELYDLIENKEKRAQDAKDYALSVGQFAATEAEIEKIERSESARADSAVLIGQQAAATGSIVIAMIAVTIIFLMRNW